MHIGLLTQHGKEALLAPDFHAKLGAHVVRITGLDTDTLGTFTLETPRLGTAVDAATRKAEWALTLSDADFGMGSEGTFHPDPHLHTLPWNTECIVLLNRKTGHRVIGMADGPAQSVTLTVATWPEALAQLPTTGFPSHHLVLRAADRYTVLAKGLSDLSSLQQAFDHAMRTHPPSAKFHLENDLRAHTNPTRQAIIRRAGSALIQRYVSTCPACHAPGWGTARPEPGARCAACNAPTQHPIGVWWSCACCGHEQLKCDPTLTLIGPERCLECNP